MEKKKLNIFHIDVDSIPGLNELDASEFSNASKEEKENMIEVRPSVSYWKDAARRFRRNKVSMAALVLFLIIFVFSYLGPIFIPYDYASQFRNTAKLGPFDYSEKEKVFIEVLKENDYGFATSLIPGSLCSLDANTTYEFKIGSNTYNFYNEKVLSDSFIVFNKDHPTVVKIIAESKAKAGVYDGDTVELKQGSANGTKINFVSSLFPHVFGTDSAGRDLMARTMYGGRVSIAIGIVAAIIVLVIGSTYGAISGLLGGAVDFIMMRFVDIIYSVPDVLIVLLLQVVLKEPLQAVLDAAGTDFARMLSNLGVGIVSIFITFACLYWVGMSRIVRGQVLQLKDQEFVTAAKALGVPNSRIIKRHLLPNCVGQLVIATCLQIPSAIFLESFLSFLGLGVSVPMTSLGSLCSEALDVMTIFPYRLLLPGFILTLLVLSLNLVGDGVRDALDPRLKK